VAIRRCREDMAFRVERWRSLDVLQPDTRRSHQPRDRVPGRRAVLQNRRWRQDVATGPGDPAQRPSRDLDRSEEPQPHPARQRRRPRRDVRPGGDVGVREHRPRRAVLRDQRGHAAALLRLRWVAGQRELVRPERDAQRQRHPELRLVPRRRRRRLLHGERSYGLDDPVLGVTGWRDKPRRPAGPAIGQHPAGGTSGGRSARQPGGS
jgi:hypothetical protein